MQSTPYDRAPQNRLFTPGDLKALRPREPEQQSTPAVPAPPVPTLAPNIVFLSGEAQPLKLDENNDRRFHVFVTATISEIEKAGCIPPTLSLLARAEAFIAGFEDDETQAGVAQLLFDLRAEQQRLIEEAEAISEEVPW